MIFDQSPKSLPFGSDVVCCVETKAYIVARLLRHSPNRTSIISRKVVVKSYCPLSMVIAVSETTNQSPGHVVDFIDTHTSWDCSFRKLSFNSPSLNDISFQYGAREFYFSEFSSCLRIDDLSFTQFLLSSLSQHFIALF